MALLRKMTRDLRHPMGLRHPVINDCAQLITGWRRLIETVKLQIIFHKRATKFRALLLKMNYKDKGSYEFSPPCTLNDRRFDFWEFVAGGYMNSSTPLITSEDLLDKVQHQPQHTRNTHCNITLQRTLQHTHCNTHTGNIWGLARQGATYRSCCNTLQYTTTYCNTLQRTRFDNIARLARQGAT